MKSEQIDSIKLQQAKRAAAVVLSIPPPSDANVDPSLLMGSVPAKAPFPTIHPIFANAFDSRIAGMIHRALLAVVEAKKRDLEIQVTRAEAAGITVIGKRKRGVNGTAAVSPVKIEDTGRVLDVDAIRALIPEIPQEANHIARRINAIVNGRLSDLVPMPTLGIPALEPLAVVPTTVIVSPSFSLSA